MTRLRKAARAELDAALPKPDRPQQGVHNDHPDAPDPYEIIRRTPLEDLPLIGEPPYSINPDPEEADPTLQ